MPSKKTTLAIDNEWQVQEDLRTLARARACLAEAQQCQGRAAQVSRAR